MTTERSHGKMRPSHVRFSDLKPAPTTTAPTAERTADGRFLPGNKVGAAAKGKSAIKALLVTPAAVALYRALLPSMGSTATGVRVLVALHCQATSMAASYGAAAERAGLTSPDGLKFAGLAERQSARAERLLASAFDAARISADHAKKTSAPDEWRERLAKLPPIAVEDDDENDDEQQPKGDGDGDEPENA